MTAIRVGPLRRPRGGSVDWQGPSPGPTLLRAEFFGAEAPAGLIGTLSATLADATLSATGEIGSSGAITGTASNTLAQATLSSASTLRVSGVLAGTLGAALASGAGGLTVAGALAQSLADATLSAEATIATAGGPVVGALAATLGDATLTASGRVGEEVTPTRAGGGGGKAFRVKSKRHASPYRDTAETAAELETRVTLEAESSDISADIPPPSEPRKSAPRKAERPDRLRDIIADTEAAAAAQGIMADALRGVEAQLRAAIAAQEMDEDEAIALVLILAEA